MRIGPVRFLRQNPLPTDDRGEGAHPFLANGLGA